MSFDAVAPSGIIHGVSGFGEGGYGDGGFGGGGFGGPETEQADVDFVVAPIDHVTTGLARVATQYRGVLLGGFGDGGFGDGGFGDVEVTPTKFIQMLTAVLELRQEIEQVLMELFNLPDIDLMEGVNLDTIGIIVGITRYIPRAIQFSFFGFAGEADQANMGEDGNPSIGSRFYEAGEPIGATSVLGDVEYRLVLRSKIIKNNSVATPPNVLAALAYITQASSVNIDDNGGMTFSVSIGRPLTYIEGLLITELDLLPRPAGVSLGGIVSYIAAGYFGFFGQANALPFCEFGTNNGAVFAEEII